MLSGCATVSQQERAAAVETVAAPPAPVLPNIELGPEVLNELLVAEVALQRAQYGSAVQLYAQLARQTRDPRLADRATRIAVFARDYQVGLEMARLWIELAPADVEGRQILTALQVKAGDYDGALASLETVLVQAGEDDEERYLLMIRLLGRDQDRDGALEVAQRFINRHPDDGAGLYAYSQLALRAGKLNEAEKAVDHLLQLKPDLTQGVILRTRILQASNREAAALEYLGQAVNRNSKDLELRVAYGRMLVDVDRPEEAMVQFKKVLKAQPDNDDITFAAALIALQLEQPKEAEEYLLRLNRKSVRIDDTSYYLGRIEEVRENYKGAIRWYNKVERGENYLNAQIRSALLQARLGDVDAARAHLGTVQARTPDQSHRLYLAEGEILRDVELYDEALKVYDRALREIPGNTELLYARAMVSEKLNRLDWLERDLLAILEREPDHVDALNSLGYTLSDRTDRLQEAETYVKRAMELKPDSFYILDSMGWVQFRKGDIPEALKYLQRAMELNGDPEVAAHLGEVQWASGDHDAARDTWKHALEQSPDNKVLLNVIKRLDK
jgi:tetratricopeptide (TPR) repeat protein